MSIGCQLSLVDPLTQGLALASLIILMKRRKRVQPRLV